MQGLFLLTLSFLATYVTSKYSNLKPLVDVKDKFEYIPIVTAIIVADLLIVWITFSKVLGDGKAWQISTKWYKKYRLSAMMADILIGVIYLLMARQFVYSMNMDTTLFGFGVLAVMIQIVCDMLFYLVFTIIPKNHNHMLDLFKDWAAYAKLDALWGDSILVLLAVVLSSYLNTLSFDTNMYMFIFSMYLIPYIIYMKD
tara:strand:- start:5873 stop:6469 length:597 start_codon:yes stop_codon:yes gene_type:complete